MPGDFCTRIAIRCNTHNTSRSDALCRPYPATCHLARTTRHIHRTCEGLHAAEAAHPRNPVLGRCASSFPYAHPIRKRREEERASNPFPPPSPTRPLGACLLYHTRQQPSHPWSPRALTFLDPNRSSKCRCAHARLSGSVCPTPCSQKRSMMPYLSRRTTKSHVAKRFEGEGECTAHG